MQVWEFAVKYILSSNELASYHIYRKKKKKRKKRWKKKKQKQTYDAQEPRSMTS